jgi:hypothetical protein
MPKNSRILGNNFLIGCLLGNEKQDILSRVSFPLGTEKMPKNLNNWRMKRISEDS